MSIDCWVVIILTRAHNCKMAESEEHGSILEDSDMILERREEQEHSEDLGDVS